MSNFLDRDTLLKQTERRVIEVPITLQDGTPIVARLRSATVTERAEYIASAWDKKGNRVPLEKMHARLVQQSLVDDSGELILGPTDRADLLGLDGGVISELYEAAADLWRLGMARQADQVGNSSETDADETGSES